jgi:hypothetical protein
MKFYQYLTYIVLSFTATKATVRSSDAATLPADFHNSSRRIPANEPRQSNSEGYVRCSSTCGYPDHYDCQSILTNIFSASSGNCPAREYNQQEVGNCGVSYELAASQGSCISFPLFYSAVEDIYLHCSESTLSEYSGGCFLYDDGSGVTSVVCMWDPDSPCDSGDVE